MKSKKWFIFEGKKQTIFLTLQINPILIKMTHLEKKQYLQSKLSEININDCHFNFIPYLDESKWNFQKPNKIGKRLYAFYSIVYLIENPEDKEKLISWLKRETIWDELAESEKYIFGDVSLSEEKIGECYWAIERASILAWVLGFYDNDLDPNEPIEFDEIHEKIPKIGESLKDFLAKLEFIEIDKQKIFLENIFNELITSTLRDISFGLKKPIPKCDAYVSFERHKTLNWIRNYGHSKENRIIEWDDVATDT